MSSRVPIPRLRNERRKSTGTRTMRACNSCRQRKWKCDGNKPICAQCKAHSLESCIYSEHKLVRERKELELTKERLVLCEDVLRELSSKVDASTSRKIEDVLQHFHSQKATRRRLSSASSSSSLDSLDGIDVVDEDVNQNKESRATGYIGKSSEVAWMQRLDSETKIQGGKGPFSEGNRPYQESAKVPVSSLNYHLDSIDVSKLEISNPYALPSKELAHCLISLFFKNVYPSFPIIRQDLFLNQFYRLYSTHSINPGEKWLAVFNLILAIGSKYCSLRGQDVQEPCDIFFARAQSLNISECILNDHEDLQQVQVETLTAFYFLASARVNRAWKMIGIASRSAIALGIHLRVTHEQFDLESLGSRARLWWSIFILEHTLSTMTGRVSCVGKNSSVPPPAPSEGLEYSPNAIGGSSHERLIKNSSVQWTILLQQPKAQQEMLKTMAPNHSLFFFCLVDLIFISQTSLDHVYNNVHIQTKQVRRHIDRYNKKLDQWHSGLPDCMHFRDDHRASTTSDPYQVSLSLHYYSIRIVLNRPCFTLPKANEKTGIRSFRSHLERNTALLCLRSSLAIVFLLPNSPDVDWAYHVAPWWAFLHFLVQATTILLLHLSVEDFKTAQPSEGSSKYTAILADVITASERAMNWLHCLKRTDEAAKRAFERLNDCVERIKSQKGLYMNGFYLKDAYRTTTIVPLHAQSGISGDLSDKSSSQGLETFCPTPQNEDAQIEKKNSSAFRQWSEVPGVALDDLQYPFGVIGDSDMSGYIQHRTDSMLSELLSSLGVPPSQSFDEL